MLASVTSTCTARTARRGMVSLVDCDNHDQQAWRRPRQCSQGVGSSIAHGVHNAVGRTLQSTCEWVQARAQEVLAPHQEQQASLPFVCRFTARPTHARHTQPITHPPPKPAKATAHFRARYPPTHPPPKPAKARWPKASKAAHLRAIVHQLDVRVARQNKGEAKVLHRTAVH